MEIQDKSTPWRAWVIDPEFHGLPPEADGHALMVSEFEGQHVTVAVQRDTAMMALEAISHDPAAKLVLGGELTAWVTTGWPEEWLSWRREWAPVYPPARADA